MKDGFLKVAAATPSIRLADCEYNAGAILRCMEQARGQGVKLLVLPVRHRLYLRRFVFAAGLAGRGAIRARANSGGQLRVRSDHGSRRTLEAWKQIV